MFMNASTMRLDWGTFNSRCIPLIALGVMGGMLFRTEHLKF